jgi:hypothetical protein
MKAWFGNILGNPLSTLAGLFQGVLSAGLVAAVQASAGQFATTGNTTDWKPYAIAGAAAFIPAAAGAFRSDPKRDVLTTTISREIDAAAQAAANEVTNRAIAEIRKQLSTSKE